MDYVVGIVLVLGAFFALVAALGLVRLPDFYCRMHAAAKAGAFGGALLAIATCLFFQDVRAFLDALLIIVFFYLTTPVASHLLGRAAYLRGVEVWEKTQMHEAPPKPEDAREQNPEETPTPRPGVQR